MESLNKFLTKAVIVCLVVFGAVLVYSKFLELNNTNEQLKRELDDLASEVEDTKRELDNLASEVEDVKNGTDLGEIEWRNDELDSRVDELDSRLEDLEDDVDYLELME